MTQKEVIWESFGLHRCLLVADELMTDAIIVCSSLHNKCLAYVQHK